MKKLFSIVLLFVLILTTFISCGEKDEVTKPDFNGDNAELETNIVGSSNRKFIYKLNMNVETTKYNDYMDALNTKLKEYNGYFEKLYESGSKLKKATIIIRVPSEKFEDIKKILYSNANVTYYDQTLDDVTSKYIDIQSRIAALQTEKQAMEAMLESANTMYDIMEIRSAITDIIYEIENYQRQLLAYEDAADYSTINLTVYELEEEIEEQEQGTFIRIKNSLVESFTVIGKIFREIFIFVAGHVHIFAVMIAITVTVILVNRKKRNKK